MQPWWILWILSPGVPRAALLTPSLGSLKDPLKAVRTMQEIPSHPHPTSIDRGGERHQNSRGRTRHQAGGPPASSHRPANPHAAANALALEHQDIARKVAANLARRTGHPREDLEQIAMVGVLLAARRYAPKRGSFRAYARTYANGEVFHYLRDQGFLIKVPSSWRELYARGRKLEAEGVARGVVARRLGVDEPRWEEIVQSCSVGVVPLGPIEPQ
jgi:RNA polymerase sigma factor (sigma-70 family)